MTNYHLGGLNKMKRYKISFNAKLNDNDVRVMQKCFCDAMKQLMNAHDCCNLEIKPELPKRCFSTKYIYGWIAHSQMTDIYHIIYSESKYKLMRNIDEFMKIFDLEQDENYETELKLRLEGFARDGVYLVNSEGPYNGFEITRINDLWILHDNDHAYPIEILGKESWRF